MGEETKGKKRKREKVTGQYGHLAAPGSLDVLFCWPCDAPHRETTRSPEDGVFADVRRSTHITVNPRLQRQPSHHTVEYRHTSSHGWVIRGRGPRRLTRTTLFHAGRSVIRVDRLKRVPRWIPLTEPQTCSGVPSLPPSRRKEQEAVDIVAARARLEAYRKWATCTGCTGLPEGCRCVCVCKKGTPWICREWLNLALGAPSVAE
ncbi:hypothetical protein GQ53DRAFT_355749 [Thozetella sp. PMI_491]|nr:hypothetical protein GQ53DRAFT_355749 [Thozetella sp. PMI_491]